MVTGTLRAPLESGLAASPVLALYHGPAPGKYTARLSAPASSTGATCSGAAQTFGNAKTEASVDATAEKTGCLPLCRC